MATAVEARPETGVRELLEAGLHFGHQTKRWNPKMKPYIFDKRNGIHIIDLAKSLTLLQQALQFLQESAGRGKSVLFVGTKKQAQQVVKDAALSCGQPYVTQRWLGGSLTNIATIRRSVKRMRELEDLEKSNALATMHKKEASTLRHELEKLRRNLTGIADMSHLPGALFVVDVSREAIAVAEASKLGIPVVAIVDTCCDPDPVQYVIPGNDDAIRAIKLIAEDVADAVRKGVAEHAKLAAEEARRREEAQQAATREAAKAAPEKAPAAAAEKAEKAPRRAPAVARPARRESAGGRSESGRSTAARKAAAPPAAAGPAAEPPAPAPEAKV